MNKELLELILQKLTKNNAWYENERSTVISAIEIELANHLPEPIAWIDSEQKRYAEDCKHSDT